MKCTTFFHGFTYIIAYISATIVGIENVSNNCYFSLLLQSLLNFNDIGNLLWDHVKQNEMCAELHRGKTFQLSLDV